jgi:hypothetical protein
MGQQVRTSDTGANGKAPEVQKETTFKTVATTTNKKEVVNRTVEALASVRTKVLTYQNSSKAYNVL